MNDESIAVLCSSYSHIAGLTPPKEAAAASKILTEYAAGKSDRIFLYHPDAVAEWVSEEYSVYMPEIYERTGLKMPLCAVMPSITPVCFATIYTGILPDHHHVMTRDDKVTADTFFDSLKSAGKTAAVVTPEKSSMGRIFRGKALDYYYYSNEADARRIVGQLIAEDRYTLISFYDGRFDSAMHRSGPDSIAALYALRSASLLFASFDDLIAEHWQDHRTLTGFAPDHGCHATSKGGLHGTDSCRDMDILHFYGIRGNG